MAVILLLALPIIQGAVVLNKLLFKIRKIIFDEIHVISLDSL